MSSQAPITESFQVRKVVPGTPYVDEPSEIVPPGWYVFGGEYDEGSDVVVRVEHAVDLMGEDAEERVARRIAGALSRPDEPTHQVSRWAELWAAITGQAPRARCGRSLADTAPVTRPCLECARAAGQGVAA